MPSSTLRLGSLGNFDSTNMMSFEGSTRAQLSFILVVLLVGGQEPGAFYGKLVSDPDVAADFS